MWCVGFFSFFFFKYYIHNPEQFRASQISTALFSSLVVSSTNLSPSWAWWLTDDSSLNTSGLGLILQGLSCCITTSTEGCAWHIFYALCLFPKCPSHGYHICGKQAGYTAWKLFAVKGVGITFPYALSCERWVRLSRHFWWILHEAIGWR